MEEREAAEKKARRFLINIEIIECEKKKRIGREKNNNNNKMKIFTQRVIEHQIDVEKSIETLCERAFRLVLVCVRPMLHD